MNITDTLLSKHQVELSHKEQKPLKISFFHFIWENNKNRKFLLIALAGILIQFIVFKIFYPFADFFSDSYSYIFAAKENLDVSIWPIGYSKFLRAFHFITSSDRALVGFQYFFFEFSALYFFYTINYLYLLSNGKQIILYIFLFFNPIFLYTCNYINSDPLFIALSLLWFTELLWIIQRPNISHVIAQGLLLFACFTIRNNAYIYPFISIIAFALSAKVNVWKRILGAALGMLLIVPFVIHTRNAAYKMTGTKQYSLFTGWQLANNALYMYGHIKIDSASLPSKSSRELNRLSNLIFIQISKRPKDYLSGYVGNFFIRHPQSPLKRFLSMNYEWKDTYAYVVAWGKASAKYEEFGRYLISRNPIAFAKYFLLLNAINYLWPPLEKLEIYNLGENEVDNIAEYWFNYRSNQITSVSKSLQGRLLFVYPYLFILISFYFIGSLIWLAIGLWRKSFDRPINATIVLGTAFIFINFFFSVFATIIVFRYQIFPMIISLSFSLLFVELMEKVYKKNHSTSDKIEHSSDFGVATTF